MFEYVFGIQGKNGRAKPKQVIVVQGKDLESAKVSAKLYLEPDETLGLLKEPIRFIGQGLGRVKV